MGPSSKEAIALQIEKHTLKKMVKIEYAIAAAFEDFELVIESFDEARGLEVHEVVGNLVPEAVERAQKRVKAVQSTGPDLGLPVAQLAFGAVFGRCRIKNGRQLLTQ